MRFIILVLLVLGGVFMSCQSEAVPNKPKKIENVEAQPIVDKPLRIEEGKSISYGGMEIKIERIVEAFFQTENGFSEQTQVAVSIKKDGKSVKWNAVYGSVTNVFGYKLKVKDCATGTSDWKSFAEFLVTSVAQ